MLVAANEITERALLDYVTDNQPLELDEVSNSVSQVKTLFIVN